MKHCPKCNNVKSVDQFHIDHKKKRPTCWCKACYSESGKQSYIKNRSKILENAKKYKDRRNQLARETRIKKPDYHVKYQLKSRYGITVEIYNQMILKQNNRCAICQKEEQYFDKNGRTRKLAVDHCHDTGKVRDLLCFRCNTTLGYLEENTNLIKFFEFYVNKHSAATENETAQAEGVEVNVTTNQG